MIRLGISGHSSRVLWEADGLFTAPPDVAKIRVRLLNYVNSGWAAFNDVALLPATYTLTYDAENRLTTVKQGTTTIASFVYDGEGKRVRSSLGTTTTAFVGAHFEWTGSTSTMVKYYYAGSQRVAMRVGSGTTNTTLKWLVGDHLGSTSVTADYAGTLISRTLYKPWGEVRYQSGTIPTNYTYTGQYSHTADFGHMYYNARWYDPYLNRFAQADTIVPGAGHPMAWDRYAYTSNNPVKYIDPSGHCNMYQYENGQCPDGELPTVVTETTNEPLSKPPVTIDDENGLCINTWNIGCSGTIESNVESIIWNASMLDYEMDQRDIAVMWGWNASGSNPFGGTYHTGGQEEVVFPDGTRATYDYGGEGGSYGASAATTEYFGVVVNVETPDDYSGTFASFGVTVAAGEGGSAAYFWNPESPPFAEGNTQGVAVGLSQGAGVSIWWGTTYYTLTWAGK